MPLDGKTSVRRAIHIRSAFDAMDVLAPAATAFRMTQGETLSIFERTQLILGALEAKYGAFHPNPEVAAAWRSWFENALHQALASMPLVLASPRPHIRYAVISRFRCAYLGYDGVVGIVSHTISKTLVDTALRGPGTALYWDRGARAAPCEDALAVAGLGEVLDGMETAAGRSLGELGGGMRLGMPGFTLGALRDFRRSTAAAAVCREAEPILAAAGVLNSDAKPTKCAFAAGGIVSRFQMAAHIGFGFAILRLLDPDISTLARKCGGFFTYPWLAALNVADEQGAVSRRRCQFAEAYPELVPCLADREQAVNQAAGGLQDIQSTVDNAGRLAPIVAAYRGWPSWVEKALKGRLAATAVMGASLYGNLMDREDGAEIRRGDAIARLLADLGPAWRPRGGDASIVTFFTTAIHELGLDASAVSAMCPSPGGSCSPWKRAWMRLPLSMRARSLRASSPDKNFFIRFSIGIDDALDAFYNDVAMPLMGEGRTANMFAKSAKKLRAEALKPFKFNTSLASLVRLSEEWHERLEVIRRAKTGGGADHAQMLSEWQPLFAPWTLVDGRVQVACLATTSALNDNGMELEHCVSSYAMDCLEGKCHIIGFSRDGQAIATAELRGSFARGFSVTQLRGHHNRSAPHEAEKALGLALLDLNGELRPMSGGLQWKREDLLAPNPGVRPATAFKPLGLSIATDEELGAGLDRRRQSIDRHYASLSASYDVNDIEAVDRVVTAWRFALPDRIRAAWDHGQTPEERVAAVRAILAARQGKMLEGGSLPPVALAA
jgi:hypothetical protein